MPQFRSLRQRRENTPFLLSDGSQRMLLKVRDARARCMRLIVSAGRLRLTLPPWASTEDAEQFIAQHRIWLESKLRQHEAAREQRKPPCFGDSATVLLRGQATPLLWREGLFARADLDPTQGIVLTAPPAASSVIIGAALNTFFEQEARRDMGAWLPKYLPTLPRAPLSLQLKPLASLWGSLSARDRVLLDLALILAPSPVFEYVLVHELCHLLVGNHSPRFWREVEQRFPDWRVQRAWLRREGMPLKAELRRLTSACTNR